MDTRYSSARTAGDHHSVPWFVMHSAAVINRRRMGEHGMTAYRRWKGKPFNRIVAEFGECIWYLKSGSAGRDKFVNRWEEGIWLGIRDESGEVIVGTKDGVVKCRDFRRKPIEEDRWSVKTFDEFKGSPWEPIPGRSGMEIRTQIVISEDSAPVTRPVVVREEFGPRRLHIRREDLIKFGSTAGCPGCRAMNRGTALMAHTEACIKRVECLLREAGDASAAEGKLWREGP